MPTFVTPPRVSKVQLVDTLETPVLMTSFITQQIDTGIHDNIYQVFQQLDAIVKPLVRNEVQQTKECKANRANSYDNFITYTPQVIEGIKGLAFIVN